ncbi:MAG: hypothetical protein KAT11_02435 [Phycisphaerae bacterium]|nr:hypothetical protein [Phycisphaerae bacterium]
MSGEEKLEKRLEQLGRAMAGRESMAGEVMGRIERLEAGTASTKRVGSHTKTWSKIMNRGFVKYAAAAVIVIGVVGLFAWLMGGNGGASVAWAGVARRIKQVDHVHFYEIKRRASGLKVSLEGWHSQGKVVGIKSDGTKYVDDGTTQTVYDSDGFQIRQGDSEFAKIKGRTLFETITHGLLDYGKQEFLTNVPSSVGEDFLIYRFDAPEKKAKWVKEVSITVGRNSLLPVQMKVYRKDPKDSYDLYIFDYTEAEKPAEFFEAKQRPAQGEADVVLGGKEVVIDISDSPGVKAVVIRLYEKEFENIGKLKVLDATLISTEDRTREICRGAPWKVNKANKLKFGPVDFKFLVNPSSEKDVYHVECWCDLLSGWQRGWQEN